MRDTQPESFSLNVHNLGILCTTLDDIIQSLQPYIEGAEKSVANTYLYGKERFASKRFFEEQWHIQRRQPDFDQHLIDPLGAFTFIKTVNKNLKAYVAQASGAGHTRVDINENLIRNLKAITIMLKSRVEARLLAPAGPKFRHELFRNNCEDIIKPIHALNKQMVRLFRNMKGAYPPDIHLKGSIDIIFAYIGKIRANPPKPEIAPAADHVEPTPNGKINNSKGRHKQQLAFSILDTVPCSPGAQYKSKTKIREGQASRLVEILRTRKESKFEEVPPRGR